MSESAAVDKQMMTIPDVPVLCENAVRQVGSKNIAAPLDLKSMCDLHVDREKETCIVLDATAPRQG